MRKNFGAKSWLYPEPVLILAAYGGINNEINLMNAAWGGISDDNELMICISDFHKTTKNILERKALTVSVGVEKYVTECDFVGIVSGNNDKNKTKKTGFHFTKSEFVDAPIVDELPFALECELKSYDENTGHLFLKIINVSIDESILDENGKIDIKRFSPICYDSMNQSYLKITEKVGKAFKDGLTLK